MATDITKETKELFLMRKTFNLFNSVKRFDTLIEIEREKTVTNYDNLKTLELQKYKATAKLELQLRALQSELRGSSYTTEDESE